MATVRKKKDETYIFYGQVGKWLKSKGWNAMVIGSSRVRSNLRKFAYTLEIDFIGKQLPHTDRKVRKG
jgi:hypothetical protein